MPNTQISPLAISALMYALNDAQKALKLNSEAYTGNSQAADIFEKTRSTAEKIVTEVMNAGKAGKKISMDNLGQWKKEMTAAIGEYEKTSNCYGLQDSNPYKKYSVARLQFVAILNRMTEYEKANGDIYAVESLKRGNMIKNPDAPKAENKPVQPVKKTEEKKTEIKKPEKNEMTQEEKEEMEFLASIKAINDKDKKQRELWKQIDKERKDRETKEKNADNFDISNAWVTIDKKDVSLVSSFSVIAQKMADSNKGLTKQSKQFKALRGCLEDFGKLIREVDGRITYDNAEEVANGCVAVLGAIFSYEAHCTKHPKSPDDKVRNRRVELVDTLKDNLKNVMGHKLLREKINKIVNDMQQNQIITDDQVNKIKEVVPEGPKTNTEEMFLN